MLHHHRHRVLIAHASQDRVHEILSHSEAKNYDIKAAFDRPDIIKYYEEIKPELLIIDLYFPKSHAIEIIELLRAYDPEHKMGIIITSLPMLQNYHACIDHNINYFLPEPFSIDRLFELVETFFKEGLKPEPFLETPNKNLSLSETSSPQLPQGCYLKFWGTRGSIATSGADYSLYGGNTTCLELRYHDTLVIFDAGTGIRALGHTIPTKYEEEIPLILSHMHLDHIIGFPFFSPLHQSGSHIHIYSPVGYQKSTEEMLIEMQAYGYFPVEFSDMPGKTSFTELREGSVLHFGEITIQIHHTVHPGSTLCFKIMTPTKIIGYVSDNEAFFGCHEETALEDIPHEEQSLIHFLQDCDVLIHEAQFFEEEYKHRVGWGHSSILNVIRLLKHLKKCKEWIVVHHDPSHTDTILAKKAQLHLDYLKKHELDIDFQMAYDGMRYPL